jgi:hypothetical protein
VQDAELEDVVAMPPHSVWPPLIGLVLFVGFVMLLLAHYLIAAGIGGVLAALLVGWHAYQPHHQPEHPSGDEHSGALAPGSAA